MPGTRQSLALRDRHDQSRAYKIEVFEQLKSVCDANATERLLCCCAVFLVLHASSSASSLLHGGDLSSVDVFLGHLASPLCSLRLSLRLRRSHRDIMLHEAQAHQHATHVTHVAIAQGQSLGESVVALVDVVIAILMLSNLPLMDLGDSGDAYLRDLCFLFFIVYK